jgi:hypothetical protein
MRGKGIGRGLNMARVIPDIREYITLEQAGLLMQMAYDMGLKRGPMPVLAVEAIVGGEG